jgi:hypothetical protein
MRKYYFLIIAGIIFNTGLYAQSQFTLYQLNSTLPQSNMVNASLFPEYKVTIGFPVLASTYISSDFGGINYQKITTPLDDPQYFAKLASDLDENNKIAINGNAQLFNLSLRFKKNFFSLSLTERVEWGISYPKSLILGLDEIYSLINNPLGSITGPSKLIAFDELGFRAQAFHELSVGYGRDITDKLSIGVRAKFLSGVVSVEAEDIGAAMLISTDSINLQTKAFNINTAGLGLIFDDEDIFKAATAFSNPGFALDIGANYWITDKLQVSLSLNDMGAINWEDDTKQYQIDEVNYTFFDGVDLMSILTSETSLPSFELETDSLLNLYSPDTVTGFVYKTMLSPKFYAAGSYHLGKHHTFGAMLYADVFKGSFKPAFGLSYNLQLGHVWSIGVNGSYRNKSFANLGLGTTLTLGAFQIYAVSDNLTSIIHTSEARFADFRFGMNLVFGKLKKNKTLKQKETTPVIDEGAPMPIIGASALNEPVVTAIAGTAVDELTPGYYIVIASINTKEESDEYSSQLQYEGYAALAGYQSERGQYYTYLMYSADDGNKAIKKKNDLKDSFAPGLEIPWVLWIKDEE